MPGRTGKRKPRIIYSRGFPYGAPKVMIRGGGTKDPAVLNYIKGLGFRYEGDIYAWSHYMDRSDFGPVLRILRDVYDCEVIPKDTMDKNYILDLDDPKFGRGD